MAPTYNDAVLANRVRETILLNPRVSAQDLGVECHDRVIILTGGVDTPQQLEAAETSANDVEGVVRVESHLYVRSGRWPPIEPEILPWPGGR